MKYTITHKCGHDEVVELFGKAAERERKISAMERELCQDCRAKEAHVDGYPDLVGTVKQVAWAGEIRKRFLSCWEENLDRYEKTAEIGRQKMEMKRADGEDVGKYEEQYKKIMDADHAVRKFFDQFIKKEVSAAWFIDNIRYAGCEPAKQYMCDKYFREMVDEIIIRK